MDINAFQRAPTITFELTSPKTGLGLGAFVEIYGTESDQYIAAQQININNRIKSAKKGGIANEYDADRIKAESTAIAVAVVKGWTGLTEGGETLPCSKEACSRLCNSFPSFRDQVLTALNDDALFFSE